MKELFRVSRLDEFQQAETHTDGFTTSEEAQTYMKDLQDLFPKEEYFIEPYMAQEPKPYEIRNDKAGISGGIDGWEDLYPSDY